MSNSIRRALLATALGACALLSAACGGGGGDAGSSAPTVSAPAQAAIRAYAQAAVTENYTVGGSCTGTAKITKSATQAGTFEGSSAFVANETLASNLPNCGGASSETQSTFYDANYDVLGSSFPGEEYVRRTGTVTPLPASVRAGDSGSYATYALFTDATRTVPLGTRTVTWTVEADSASSLVLTLVLRDTTPAGAADGTQRTRYRITTVGVASVASIEFEVGTARIVFTRN
jgi:hypothetical protein